MGRTGSMPMPLQPVTSLRRRAQAAASYWLQRVLDFVSGIRCTNKVTARQVRLVLGWVTVCGPVCHLGMLQAK